MLTPTIFSPSIANFLTVLAFVAALAILWVVVRFALKLTRMILTVGCLSLLALAGMLILFTYFARG